MLLCLALACASALGAQETRSAEAASRTRAERGSELTVYLLTMGPGDQVWERFGHNAIWIRDSARGTDIAYNWGLFDFDQADFLQRFIAGDMRYWMDGFDVRATIEAYAADNRSVWAQELTLAPAQRAALRDFIQWNRLPENKFYRYDYYRDNCSTRVRDALDRALGGQLRRATAALPTASTYRSHTRRLTADDIPVYTGTLLGLGRPVDQPISVWDDMFIPMRLRQHLRDVRVTDEHGRAVPLVQSETTLFQASRAPEPDQPPNRTVPYLIVGVGFGALLAWLARGTAYGGKAARLGLAVLGSLWSLLAGVVGVGLLVLWTLTDHVFTANNENVLQFNPLSLGVVLLLPLLLYRGATPRATTWLTLAVAALAVAGLVLQLLPMFDQTNGEIIVLALPMHVGLAWAVAQVGAKPARGRARARRRPTA